MTLVGRLKKKRKQEEEPIIYSICGLRHVLIIKSLLLDNFSLRSQQLDPNYFPYPYRYPEFHLRKIWPQFWANRHFPNGNSHYDGLHTNCQIEALLIACNLQSSSWAWIVLLLIPGLLVGRGKKVKFRGIFRGKFAEKTADFAGISREFLRPVSLKNDWELPEQISLESDCFCADLRKVFNETRRSYRFTQASYRNMKAYFTRKLIEHNKNK